MENPSNTKTILITDIGATNCRVEVYFGGEDKKVFRHKYQTAEFGSMDELIDRLIVEVEGFDPKTTFAASSIASKIIDNKVATTANYKWTQADGNALKEKYGFLDFRLLNDFEACGYSLLGLTEEDVVPVKASFPKFSPKSENSNFVRRYAFVGPGTGLGVCQAILVNGKLNVLSSEGGHIGIFPWNDEMHDLMKFIRNERPKLSDNEIISAEHLFCGLGIPYIFKFLWVQEKPVEEFNSAIKGEEVFSLAREGDSIALRTIELFIELLAATLQHLSAGLCPENGILLSGGILNSIKDIFLVDTSKEDSRFFKIFYNNVSIRNFLTSIPIYLCQKDELGLFGCMSYALQNLD